MPFEKRFEFKNLEFKNLEYYLEKVQRQREEIKKRVVGMSDLIDAIFITFYSPGGMDAPPHLLVEGVPGTGKTLTAKTFARTIKGIDFKRIQFKADLMPSDITGYIDPKTKQFMPGPIFVNIFLGDEINRGTSKTQGALLEAMAERQVTDESGLKHNLDVPFFVIATQNPLETEGVYPLGVANEDRFMMKVYTKRKTPEEMEHIIRLHGGWDVEVAEVITKEEAIEISEFIRTKIYMDQAIEKYIVSIWDALDIRKIERLGVNMSNGTTLSSQYLSRAPEDRGPIFLSRAVKTRAFLQGRQYVVPGDVDALAFDVLHHRIDFQFPLLNAFELKKELIKKALEKARGEIE